jgi:hypothetical protein
VLLWPPSGHNDNTYDQDTAQDKPPSEQTVASSIPYQLDLHDHESTRAVSQGVKARLFGGSLPQNKVWPPTFRNYSPSPLLNVF